MKALLLTAFSAITAGALLAQDAPAPAPAPGGRQRPGGAAGPGGAPGGRMFGGGGDTLDMITGMLQNPAVMQNTLGLTDEQVAKLRPLLAEVDAKIREVDAKIQKLGLDQANVFAKALADKEDESEKELLALTDKIGEASVERARLRIQRLLVLKQVLTPEQVAKAADLVKERAARQVELNKAMAEGDMATVQRLMNEMRQQGGFGPGGFGPGGGAQGGGRGQGGPGGNNNNNGGNRGNRAGGGNNNGGGNRGGGNRGGNNNNNNAGGGNNNANAPAPAGWGN